MASCFCCFRCTNSLFGPGHVPLKELPVVKLDTSHMGNDVVIVKNGKRICGTGAALANAPILQNKAYFEIKIQSTGIWGVGLATQNTDVNKVPIGEDAESWVLRHTGELVHNKQVLNKLSPVPQEGDIVGLSFDHIDLKFYINGEVTEKSVTGIKGTAFPIFYVDDGAVLDVQFEKFYHTPPDGYDSIMIEQSLL
ncbi:hypothetical protein LOTGIDRAFT_125726 [Lottia gigantea]|uniref:SPRY domain-containing protein 7 n=1 Tax=Lottia gigantea TaxID=225164 RepID=V3ZW06_LOTGI|nr:hypothetical protein LOTGIDRAFT_125726 [Lottia gigantea]ESO88552.1 hypothetical protein LOTGIDRAFT_125726 [Lottia gigantea]